MTEWISVEDRLPDDSIYLLGCDANLCMWVVCFYEGHWEDMLDRQIQDITHWMPLPKPPASNREN